MKPIYLLGDITRKREITLVFLFDMEMIAFRLFSCFTYIFILHFYILSIENEVQMNK